VKNRVSKFAFQVHNLQRYTEVADRAKGPESGEAPRLKARCAAAKEAVYATAGDIPPSPAEAPAETAFDDRMTPLIPTVGRCTLESS
jgi:hypothetical protein